MLIESAWHYRFPARESRALRERNGAIPDNIRAIAWKAQVRLCGKYRRLANSGKQTVKVVTAVARAGRLHLGIARNTPVATVEPQR